PANCSCPYWRRMDLFWVNDVVAVATRPRGGDWLKDDLAEAQRLGVRRIVSCLTSEEESDLGLSSEAEDARSLGLQFVPVRITDMGIPGPGVVEEALSHIARSPDPEGKTAIHCRQG